MKICKWCGLRIKFATSPIDDYWYHSETELIWCDEAHTTFAEPNDRTP